MSDMPTASLEIYQSNTSRSFIILSQGDIADAATKAAFDKAVRNVAPNYGKAAFERPLVPLKFGWSSRVTGEMLTRTKVRPMPPNVGLETSHVGKEGVRK